MKNTKILVTGVTGQLGSILTSKLIKDCEVIGYNSKQLNITDKKQVFDKIMEYKPNIVINCASYNNVKQAETDRVLAEAVNSTSIGYLSEACNVVKSKLVHISTDFVFDGRKQSPYVETDETNPLNYYGFTKLAGERTLSKLCENYLLVRTSWLYSILPNNFLHAISRLAKERKEISVVSDQIGTPTNAHELADIIIELLKNEINGVVHCSGEGQCSWYEFAKAIIEYEKIPCNVLPVTSEVYGEKVIRPKYSVLENKRINELGGISMQHWMDSLEKYYRLERNIKSRGE